MRLAPSLAVPIALLLGGCAMAPGQLAVAPPWQSLTPGQAPSVPAHVSTADPLATTRTSTLDLGAAVARWRGPELPALTAFYAGRGYAPVWFGDGPYADQRVAVADELRARGAAVDPTWTLPAAAVADQVGAELGLTAAALASTRALSPEARAARSAANPAASTLLAALADAVEATQPTGGVTAGTDLFEGQAAAIARYREIAAAGGWPALPDGPSLEPGAVDPRLDVLRARLVASGDLDPGTSAGPVYDAVLARAVERFQARHGLTPDAVVGPATRRALNVPVEVRLRQLERAEAARAALGRRLGDRFVLVNVPAYELRYVEGGAVRHRADVIVGSAEHQTPLFSHAIDHLVFNPGWSVPPSIANRALLPKFKKNPAQMAREGYVLVDANGTTLSPTDVDWSTVGRSIPYRVRQHPGDDNALGAVKFMFPNEHAVYLHDTPSKKLFAKSMRALSNGCVRVQDPLTLAELLLATDGWDRTRIDGLVASDKTRTVTLGRPVPVHLVYLTAWTDPDGSVQFRDDVYGLEQGAVRTAAR